MTSKQLPSQGQGGYRLCQLVLAACCLLQAGCSRPPEPVDFNGVAFNVMAWHVRLNGLPDGVSQQQMQDLVQARIDAVDATISSWRPDSELMQFNHAPIGQWVKVSPRLYHTVDTALRVSALTGGAYDISVVPLVNAWGFGPAGRSGTPPTEAVIKAAQARVGWRRIGLDPAASALMRKGDVELDLASVGEGAAVDDIADMLEARGIRNYMVSVAGGIRAHGRHADGQPWHVAVERPDGSGQPERVLNVQDASISTAGSYRNFFKANSQQYSHIIDPRTGHPITHAGVSVTIVLPAGQGDCTLADAFDTGILVLSPDEEMRLAERLHLAAFFIQKSGNTLAENQTAELRPYLKTP